MTGSARPIRIVVVGGGFGGVYTARHLERLACRRRDIQITLVSRNNYLTMTPLLFEASSGILEPRHAVQPIRLLLKSARFVKAEADYIDFHRRLVFAHPTPDEVYELSYDQLVLAVGGVTDRAMIPGSELAFRFKTLADAIFVRNHVIELFERAEVDSDPDRRRALLRFVVIGGGLVGVELLGELTVFTRNLCVYYPHVRPADLRFELLEAGPEILHDMDRGLVGYIRRVFDRRGVRIRTSCPAQVIEADCVRLADGQVIDARTIILTTGVAPNPLLKDLPLEKDRKGRIAVDAAMRSVSHPDVWALGDCARIPDPIGLPYPQLAQHALREARTLAHNIMASSNRRPTTPFVYKTVGTLAALGHYKGVGRIMKIRLRGFAAWWVWRTYYLWQMPRWERRLRIILDWTIALFFKNDCVELDLFDEEHPLQWRERQRHARAKPQVEPVRWTITGTSASGPAAPAALPMQPGEDKPAKAEASALPTRTPPG